MRNIDGRDHCLGLSEEAGRVDQPEQEVKAKEELEEATAVLRRRKQGEERWNV